VLKKGTNVTNPGTMYELEFQKQGQTFGTVKLRPWDVYDVAEHALNLLYQFNATRSADRVEIRRDGQFIRVLSLAWR
jgi:hypothetical protein